MEKKDYSPLFTPFKIGKMEIKNRLVLSPMGHNASLPYGAKSDWEIDYQPVVCVYAFALAFSPDSMAFFSSTTFLMGLQPTKIMIARTMPRKPKSLNMPL